MHTAIPRSEHPRPDFMRDTFVNLNGAWQFAFDDADVGLTEGWQRPGRALPMTITVPFVDYNGEQAAEVDGVTYAIYRTYLVNNDWDVELHLGTRVGVSM